MCGMFLLEDSKSIVDMLVNQGKDRAAMEAELSWYFLIIFPAWLTWLGFGFPIQIYPQEYWF